MTVDVDEAASLRQAMVAALRSEDLITTDSVAAGMSTVPRHVFAPGEPLEKVYRTDTTLVPKIDAQGRQTSVVSASHIQAIQLEEADAWDIPPTWLDQLTPTGRIVVPLRFAGITRLIAFDRTPGSRALRATRPPRLASSHSWRLTELPDSRARGERRHRLSASAGRGRGFDRRARLA